MNNEFSYILKRKKGYKKIRLEITRNSEIIATTPFFVLKTVIDDFVLSRTSWIKEKLDKINTANRFPEIKNSIERRRVYFDAKKLINNQLQEINKDNEFVYKKISVKDMKTRWGSCSSEKNLNFNYRLLYLPLENCNYIIIHELCHLKEMNHGKNFWSLVSKYCPNYKVIKRDIKKYLLC